MLITMNVNGKKVDIDVSYDEYLVDTLRRIGNLSVKEDVIQDAVVYVVYG